MWGERGGNKQDGLGYEEAVRITVFMVLIGYKRGAWVVGVVINAGVRRIK